MNIRIILAVVVGVVPYVFRAAFQAFSNHEGLKIILVFITLFIGGLVPTGVKTGLLLIFLLPLALSVATTIVLSPEPRKGVSNSPSSIRIYSTYSRKLCDRRISGAIGDLLGMRVFK